MKIINPNKPTAEKAITNILGYFHLVSFASCLLVESLFCTFNLGLLHQTKGYPQGVGNWFSSLPHSCGWFGAHESFWLFFFFKVFLFVVDYFVFIKFVNIASIFSVLVFWPKVHGILAPDQGSNTQPFVEGWHCNHCISKGKSSGLS